MASRRKGQVVALLLALALLLPTSLAVARALDESPADVKAERERARVTAACERATGVVARAVHQYVDQFGGLTGFEDQVPAAPDEEGLVAQFTAVRNDLVAQGCALEVVRDGLRTQFDAAAAVDARGPLARTVSAMVTSTAMRVLGESPAEAVEVAPGDDLAAAVASAPPGGTVRLAAGRHEVADPVYVLRDVEIVGAGRERTEVVSTASGAAILVPRTAEVRLSGFAVRHDGAQPASTLVVWAGHVVAADLALSGGSTTDKAGAAPSARGAGGSGLVLADSASVDLTDAVVEGNQVAGAVTGGRSSLTAKGVAFRDNRLCGVCVLDRARTTVQGGELAGNTAGAYVAGNARATLRGSVVRDNSEAGIAVQEKAGVTVVHTEVRDNAGLGIGVKGSGRTELSGNTVRGSGRAGILLNGTARSDVRVTGNDLAGNAAADIVVNGTGTVVVRSNVCGSTLQLVRVDGSSPTLADNRCTVQRRATG